MYDDSTKLQNPADHERIFSKKAMTEINASIDGFGDKIDRFGDKIDRFGDKIDRFGDKIDGLGDKIDGLAVQVGTFGDKIDDLAVQVGTLTEGITRLERTVEALVANTKEQHEIARSQSENVAELIKLATALAVRG